MVWRVDVNNLAAPLVRDSITLFFSIVVEAIPFLLLGVLLSGILAVFVDERQLARLLPKGRWSSSLVGGLSGFLFPVCECGNVAVARRLILKGTPPSVAIAFLLAAPVFNPVVIVATWIAFRDRPEIVLYRVGFSLAIAVLVGWIFSCQQDWDHLLQPSVVRELKPVPPTTAPSLLAGGTFLIGSSTKGAIAAETDYSAAILDRPATVPKFGQRWPLLLETWTREIRELGGILVISAATAGVLQVAVPRQVLLDFGQGMISSIAVMMVLGLVVSICSTVDAFFALAFAATFTTGSLVAFLVFGPMVDLKGIGLLLSVFRPKAIAYLVLLISQFAFTAAVLVNYYGS